MNRIGILCIAAASFAATSCSHKVGYFLGDEDIYLGPRVPKVVKVNTFSDNSPKSERINLSVSGELWRINGNKGYRDGETLADAVSRCMAEHLNHSTLFTKVYGPNDPIEPGDNIDYYIDATIHDYVAMGKVKPMVETTALVATSFLNVPGALASTALTRGIKTTVQTGLELRNLRLTDAQDGNVIWNRVKVGRQQTTKQNWMQADAPNLYKRIDNELRLLTNQIIEEMAGSAEVKAIIPPDSGPPMLQEIGG